MVFFDSQAATGSADDEQVPEKSERSSANAVEHGVHVAIENHRAIPELSGKAREIRR
jgi:hypothetical protein